MASVSRPPGPPKVLFLAVLACLHPTTTLALSEKETLTRLYRLASGKKWINKFGWKESADEFEGTSTAKPPPVCSWYGVRCFDDNGEVDMTSDVGVVEVNLADNQLSGKITQHLWDMPFLENVDIRNNQLTDAGLEGMAEGEAPLKSLILSENQLTSLEGLEDVGDDFEELHINENAFEEFPEEVFSLKKLKVLMATHNDGFTGPMPTEFGKMTNLRKLLMWYNAFSGSIPTQLGNLKKLEQLGLDENKLAGSLPSEMGNMYNLQYFSCQNFEPTSGRITGKIPKWENLVFLKEVYLDYNGLTGTFPEDFLKNSNVTDKSVYFGFDQNQIKGSLPKDLTRFKKMKLDLRGNEVERIPNELCKMKNWMNGKVEQFGCDAILCPIGTYLVTGRQETEDVPCKSCPNGLAGAPFLGSGDCSDAEGGETETDVLGQGSDQQILVEFALAMELHKWVDSTGWEKDLKSVTAVDETLNLVLDYCQWKGVECDSLSSKKVTKLALSNNGLKGKVPKDIYKLSALTELDLSHNDIRMDGNKGIGRVEDAKNLQSLFLDETDIETVNGISKATNLKYVTLDDTYLEGPFPDEFLQMKNLVQLRAQFAGLTGTLPTKIGTMENLEKLNVYGNMLTGKIPTQLGGLSKLHILELAENEFTGTIPTELNGMPKLNRFSVHQSSREGDGLSGTLPPFDDCPNLNTLRVDSNSLVGPIPDNLLAGVSDKTAKVTLGLSYNTFTGVLPSQLADFDHLNIDAVANDIFGVADALCQKTNWNDGEVGLVANSCDAILCPKGTYNIYGMATTKLSAPCESCPTAAFMGTTYCTEQDKTKYAEKKIIDALYYQTGGPEWESSTNWLESGKGICNYEGIKCEGNSHDNEGVTEINLNSFGLSGDIPSSIWDLPSLRSLELADNSVDIDFDGIENAENLKVINLAGAEVSTVDGIQYASDTLEDLYLERNDFSGTIFKELFELNMLRRLKIDYNHFSGTLSYEIKQMKHLEEFWCYGNDISGTLPPEIGDLTKMKYFVMGENELSGFLPEELGKLVNLEYLSFYGQRGEKPLSGPVYDFEPNKKLTHLVLARNAFSGPIPFNFLGSTSVQEKVTVDLSFNEVSGGVPQDLERFNELNINLVGNQITDLPPALCAKNSWMNGKVGQVEPACDAIMCPKGYFNEIGRLEDESRPCRKCTHGEDDNPYYGSIHCGASERSILTQLYQLLNGDNWTKKKSWMSKKDPICKWYGIECADGSVDSDEGVIKIILPNNGLDGGDRSALYSKLFYQLPFLKELDLKGNPVPLQFDGIGDAAFLETLALSNTGLKDITNIGQAQSVRELHLTDNALNMKISETEIFDLKNIKRLFLSYNKFKGTIPTKIGQLTKLTQFWSYQNQLEGQLPTEFGLLKDLEFLIISENKLSGTIPDELAGLTQMKDLALFNQQGKDAQISGKLPDFSAMTQLTILDLEYNQISGSIPQSFMSGSVAKAQYIRVALNHNDLTGTVPSSLQDFDNLSLEIVGNKITEISTTLCGKSDWMDGSVGEVGGCYAIACPPYTFSDSGRQETKDKPCSDCPEAPNPFVGQDSCVPANHERDILKAFWTATNGQFWVNNMNWMEDRMPICSWDRVFCGLGNEAEDQGVIKLDMESNELDGDVPSSIYQLPFLKEINLKKNYDAVLSFDGIENAKELEVLYLSEIIVDSLDGLGKAPNLKRIHLTGCELSGTFPDEIFDLSSTLQEMYIAYNDFTGTIPTRIGEMKLMTDFYAYDNEFSGTIPSQIANMESLVNLVLAENLLSGQIPPEMGSMKNLQLFSSFRRVKEGPKLSGTLPSFANAPQLTDLYLDHNSIGGSIPKDFLSSASQIFLVTLSDNELTGTVSKEIFELPPFQLELEDNRFSHLSIHACKLDDWMHGDVGTYGCDAIMCEPGYASRYGRQNSTDTQCQKCSGSGDAPYWGSTSCAGKTSGGTSGGDDTTEWKILMSFYLECGGSNWHKNDGWGEEDVPICQWYGITCTDQKTVEAIRLGANNIIGTPPSSLFDLPDLMSLWLYSNPIRFSFYNIGNAQRLVELRIDSTGLSSVEGIGKATSLEVLDLRFNRLSGGFPNEILSLTKLQSLSMGDNAFMGTLPPSGAFSKMQMLTTLRLGVNEFVGKLPDFGANTELIALDVSHNFLTGSIPSSFLERVASNVNVQIDLAENQLSGTVPVQLDRFQSMTIYLRNNMITGLPKELCDSEKGIWLKGDVKRYSCDAIACPPGTYNALGRQSTDETPCLDCGGVESPYYGQTQCGGGSSSSARQFSKMGWIVQAVFTVLAIAYQVVV